MDNLSEKNDQTSNHTTTELMKCSKKPAVGPVCDTSKTSSTTNQPEKQVLLPDGSPVGPSGHNSNLLPRMQVADNVSVFGRSSSEGIPAEFPPSSNEHRLALNNPDNDHLESKLCPPSDRDNETCEDIPLPAQIECKPSIAQTETASDECLTAAYDTKLPICLTQPVEESNFPTHDATPALQGTFESSVSELKNVLPASGSSKPDDGSSSYQCSHCNASFHLASKLTTHACRNKDDRLFHCDQCPKAYRSRSGLKYHKLTHLDTKPWQCFACQHRFNTKRHMVVHERRMHGAERTYKCDVCPRVFISAPSLKEHKRVHVPDCPCHCHLCPATFKNTIALRQHVERLHETTTAGRPLTCRRCGLGFVKWAALIAHHRCEHARETLKACPLCPALFTKNVSLQMHLRRHGEDTLYCCEKCYVCFVNKYAIKEHLESCHRP